MSYFLLVVTFALSSGKGVSVEKFHSEFECVQAMRIVSAQARQATVTCTEVTLAD